MIYYKVQKNPTKLPPPPPSTFHIIRGQPNTASNDTPAVSLFPNDEVHGSIWGIYEKWN